MSNASDSIGWGIVATGKIARSFAADLALVPGAHLAAVGSRSEGSARAFAERYGDGRTRAHGSYEALVADAGVDVVYIATPHALHLAGARAAFEAGKHVLCEKPVTLRAADAEEMVRLAGEHDRFLMEAMWTACHPVIRELRRELASGRFGTPRHVAAELGFRVDADPTDRMLAPELGGGALLDMGIYPLTFAHLLLGEAEDLRGVATVAPSGVDLDIAIAGRYPGGAVATLHASMTSWSSRAASIATDLGRITLDGDFHHPTAAVFTPIGRPDQQITLTGDEPVIGRGYGNEIAEVDRCLGEGLRESPLVPHEQTLTVLRQMDGLRADLGIRYPDDPA
ncbi:Gfo/Idh/MocA family oxidoreductase [Nocardioides albidus]|uniref:Gfo/Idh/MocA family oxidoreductase n=1 Tax=Nocardioides albidus TaxID=1517589 RepID=A0A5C4VX61_9ACTN|nr:Gfo/Idh/MocA family oxidoreductase [Nocardioides albidus]TNM40463.1 Gfo/Idh/MocA family oxidoreductase [Nocardioides albidus]